MKAFKKLAGLCLGITLCFGLCAFAACDKESAPESSSPAVESSSPADENEATAYVFTVLDKDGNPLKDMAVMLCIPGSSCYPPIYTDENGKVSSASLADLYKIQLPAQVLEIHVGTKDNPSDYLDFEGAEKTEAVYGEYTLKLKA